MRSSTKHVQPRRSDNVIAGAVIVLVVGTWSLSWLGLKPGALLLPLVGGSTSVQVVSAPPASPPSRRSEVSNTSTSDRARHVAAVTQAETVPSGSAQSMTATTPPAVAVASSRVARSAVKVRGTPSRSKLRTTPPDDRGEGLTEHEEDVVTEQASHARAPLTTYVTPSGRTVIVAPRP